MPTSPSTAAGLFAGRYAVERILGQGATATVHLALDQRTGERVAIKMLRPELAASGAAERFLKEIALTASLKHPGILVVLDSGQHEGQMYFTLPYMEGGTLRQKLKRERQLSLDDAVAIVSTIAEALDHAHARGLVHRDVKPENILFTEGRAVIGDFGIARALQTVYGDGTTSSATIRGTPAYMSPEQAAGAEKLDGRSDVFSLACVAYEMVTGMQAFMGPTPESVVAQRFAFTPREIRAYRPAAPTSIDGALARAFTLSPADRYPTAGELARALEVARNAATPVVAPAPRAKGSARWMIAAGLVGVAMLATLTFSDPGRARSWFGLTPPVDTTRVAILPFDDAGASLAAEDLLSERLRRYRGIAVVESFATADAVRQRGTIASLADARSVALALGAGRYIRGRVISSGADRALYAAMYSSATNSELYHARVQMPADSTLLLGAYAALADSLVLRGSKDGAPTGGRVASLPAVQAFVRGRSALNEWDLARAESLFSVSAELDPANGRAQLWLAQVRSWNGVAAGSWRSNADHAVADSATLSADERQLAVALRALAFDDFAAACATYRQITRERPRDFAGWYGLGECHRADRAVIADARSPSGWRFRSSYYQAMLAYQRAFEVFPSSYRAYQGNAFQALHQLLFTNPSRLRQGFGSGSPAQVFLSKPAASGDTVLFVPYPRDVVLGGASIVDSVSLRYASERARRVFHRVTSAWSTALPGSPGTKEAMAISLEVMGDLEAAIDTVRAGRRLAADSSQQIRLAVQEVMLVVKLGLTRGGPMLQRATALADSVLTRRPRHQADAEQLTRVAVLLGRCGLASTLAQSAATPVEGLPPSFVSAVFRHLPGIALGCAPASTLPHLSTRSAATLSDPNLVLAEYGLIGGMAGLGYPENPALIERMAKATSDFVLVVEDSLIKGNTGAARRILRTMRLARPSEAPPEAALAEARLWLALGDTVAAVQALDSCIDAASTTATLLPVGYVLANSIRIASLSRALALRADLAAARGAAASRWARPVAEIWIGADRELQPTVQRMKELSSRCGQRWPTCNPEDLVLQNRTIVSVAAVVAAAVLGWCYGKKGGGPNPEPFTAMSHGACGLTALELRKQDSTKQLPVGVIAWPTMEAPEFQDDQRFTDGSGPSRKFGPVACVVAHPSLESYAAVDFAQPAGVWVAAIYVGSTPAITPNDPYDDLGLRAGWNCLFLRTLGLTGMAVRGLVVQPDNAGTCNREANWVGRPAHRSHEAATTANHYPPVARFVEKKNSWRVGIGVKCVDWWCNYGINAPADVDDKAHAVPATTHPNYSRHAVLGWHDQQHLLIGAVTSGGTGGQATLRSSIVPVHNLETFTTRSHFLGITKVAEVFFPDNNATGTKYANGWGFTLSGTTPDTLALQLREGADPLISASWRVFVNGIEKANLHVNYTSHATIFNPNPYIPGTARWRWKDNDEAIWVRCLDGCCEVDM